LGTYALFLYSFFSPHTPQPHKKTVQLFFIGVTFVLLLQLFSSYIYPVTILIQAQIIRVGAFLLLFSYLYFLHLLVSRFERKQIDSKTFLFFSIAAIFIPAPFIFFLLVYFFKGEVPNFIRNLSYFLIVILLFITFVITYTQNLWLQGMYIYPRKTPLYKAQLWAKQNTPKNATFLVPPYLWDFYDVEWRVISERSAFVTLSELLEAAFEPNYINSWISRFDIVAPGARTQFHGDFFANKKITRDAFIQLSEQQIKEIAQKNSLRYLVTETGVPRYTFPIIYSNSGFIIYAL